MKKTSLYSRIRSIKGPVWPIVLVFIILVVSYLIYRSLPVIRETIIEKTVDFTHAATPTAVMTTPNNPTTTPESTAVVVQAPAQVITLPPQGLYESCLPDSAECLQRLSEMSAKGFTIVLNDGLRYSHSAQALRTYADAASKLGMQVILPVKYNSDWDADDTFLVKKFPDLAREGGSKNNEEFITYYVNVIKDHPALWGYYIADEVHVEYYQGLKFYADLVKQIDPSHPRLIVEEGTNDPMELFFTFPSQMHDVADVLGIDYYPYGYIDTFTSLSRFTGASARLTQAWSEKLGRKSAMVLQAYAQPQYQGLTNPLCMPWPACSPFPNYEQMKAQRDQVLLNSKPEIILWFSYPDIMKSDDPEKHWNDLVAAAFSPLPNATAAPRTTSQSNCPSDWVCEDIGLSELPGTHSFTNGTWQIEGVGWDIWSDDMEKADQFHFIWQKFPLDGELGARLVSQNSNQNSAKAGIMLRKTFDPISPYYAVLELPGKGIFVQYRAEFGLDPVRTRLTSSNLPIHLKIVREKNIFSAYISENAQDWTLLPGSSIELPTLEGELMAGLAVSSGSETSSSTAVFDQVNFLQSD